MGRWSSDREMLLRRLVRQGMTDPQIATALGVTNRAVIGKRQRLGLSCNRQPQGFRKRPVPTLERAAHAANETSWDPPPGMLKLNCEHCGYWFAAPDDGRRAPLLCATCAA